MRHGHAASPASCRWPQPSYEENALINPDARKWRLEEVAISGLFGRYNHRFTLDQDHRVTILHGPNGVGKTAMLRLLYAIFAGRTFQLFATKFAELYLSFDSGETVRIRRESSVEDPTAEHIVVQSSDALGLETTSEAFVDAKVLTKFASSIARRLPWLERIDDEVWIDRRTAERLTTGELLSKFDGSDPDLRPARIGIGEQIKPLLKLHGIVQELSRRVSVHIIETQRLLSKPRRGERRPYREEEEGDSEVRTTVLECAEELKKRIAASLSRYATESQRRDQSFPFRLLNLAQQSRVDTAKLQRQLSDIGDKRRQLAEIGLLVDKTEPYAESLERLDLASADDAQRRVIELYAGDTAGKLAALDEVLQVARLFFGVVNTRFRHKQLALDRERGLIANTVEQDSIRLDALSSGEQHQLVLFFDLIFRVRPGSIVLIDEPELSLHISWQKSMLDSLIEIAAAKSLDIVIATHSPYIVGSRVELMRDLGSPDYSEDAFI